ncbi:MAG: N-acetylmuramoyl-L-alanine amidase [bacterium]
MKKIIILLAFLEIFLCGICFAKEPQINIIYPPLNKQINADSTFFIGNTTQGSQLELNGELLNIRQNGGFVKKVQLKSGKNTFKFISTYQNKKNSLDYNLYSVKKPLSLSNQSFVINTSSVMPNENSLYPVGENIILSFQGSKGNKAEFSFDGKCFYPMTEVKDGCYQAGYTIKTQDDLNLTPVIYRLCGNSGTVEEVSKSKISILPDNIWGKTIKNEAVIRTAPTMSRLTPLPQGTNLKITAKIGNEYRFEYGNISAFIKAEDVEVLQGEYALNPSQITTVTTEETAEYTIIKIPLNNCLPVKIEENFDNNIDLYIYNALLNISTNKIADYNSIINTMLAYQPYENVFKLNIKTKSLYGYSYDYENNTFVLRLKKMQPKIDNVLKNRVIAIDAGHGGSESGAVGLTGIAEKTVNLKIAEYLKTLLEQQGAKVVMTREDDKYVELYERVNIARQNKSDILVSVHNNALADGSDPNLIHGSESYFYHPHSLALAKAIQPELVKETGFNDNGVYYNSLVLTRPSDFPAVLVEAGYMIYPDEYEFLITDEGQKTAAKAIFNGIKKYFEAL